MKNLAYKLLILIVFVTNSLHIVAGDTIKIVTISSKNNFSLITTLDKQFTVRCVATGFEETFTGTGEYQSIYIDIFSEIGVPKEIIIEGEEGCAITLFSNSASRSFISLDFSKCPSINWILASELVMESINLSNCVNLENLEVSAPLIYKGSLRDLDVRDCRALLNLSCGSQSLSVLDLSNNPALGAIYCMNNKFPLSSLYDIHQVMIDRGRRFGIQRLGSRRILLNETLDYSSQKEFGGAATNFWILNGHRPDGFDGSLADPSEYTVDNGEITFHKDGLYTVDMRNPNVYSDPQVEALVPTRVILLVQVIDFVPVTEITNVPASVSVGEQYIFSSYRIVVLPENATYKQVNWEITDAGTTGATIFGTRLRTTAPGTVKVRGTIKEGLAFDEDYTQDFVIEIEPLGIDEAAQGLEAIEVYPNPTTGELRIENGELRIENVEIFDISGKVVSSHHLIPTSSHHLINISHLQAGTYFVKIATEQGEVVKKVIKQ